MNATPKARRRRRFFRKVLKRYAGLCIALPDESVRSVIAYGDNEEEAKKQAEATGVMEPFLIRLPGL